VWPSPTAEKNDSTGDTHRHEAVERVLSQCPRRPNWQTTDVSISGKGLAASSANLEIRAAILLTAIGFGYNAGWSCGRRVRQGSARVPLNAALGARS
jgi:hypothetical protein